MLGGDTVFDPTSPTTAVADSQIRFFGSAWAGYGVLLWWASDDLRSRQTPLALLGGVSLAAGIGRMVSSMKFGFGAEWTKIAMWAEFIGPVGVYAIGRAQGVWQ